VRALGAAVSRNLVDDPKFWHSRAEKARAMAEDFKHRDEKEIWNRIADDYEQLAKHAEQRRTES
jgi:hypothetical protein